MSREFAIRSIEVGGVRRNAHQIFCSECNTTAHMNVAARGGAFHSDLVARHFRQKGWEVGKDPKRDVCPACQKDAREARRAKLTVVTSEEEIPVTEPAKTPVALVADAPRGPPAGLRQD